MSTDESEKSSTSQHGEITRSSRDKPTFSLRLKILVFSGLLATIPLAVIGLRLIDVNASAVELLSRELQLAVVDDIGRTVDAELDESIDRLNALGRVLTNDQLPPEQVLTLALALVESAEVLDHAAVYDREGNLIDIIREEEAAVVSPPKRLSSTILRRCDEEHSVADEVRASQSGPRVLVVVPLRAGDRTTGYAASLVSLELLQRRVEHIAVARFHGSESSVFVVDQRMRTIAHPNRRLARELRSAADQPILAGASEQILARRLVRSGEIVTDHGQRFVASVAALGRRPWAVVVQVPEAEAYASLERMRTVIIETILITIIIALLLAFIVARRITAPVAKLTSFAGALSQRRFDAELSVNTRDELSILAKTLSGAARDLAESEKTLKRETEIRGDLGRYLPAELVEQIVRREREVKLGGERRELTVLFADVVAFTPLTEERQPEEVVALLNELFTILTSIIFRHGGTVDKFIGDCVMALWGAPTPQEDHALRALEAAEEMLGWLETGNARWQKQQGVTIRLAIGVHTGEVVVGNIGSESRMEYTAIGDVVNVAARLESIARPGQILITRQTRDAAGDSFEFNLLRRESLAGHSEAVELFEVVL